MFKKMSLLSLLAALIVLCVSGSSFATVEWNLLRTLQIEGSPLDTAVTADGKLTFVLIDDGTVLIYSAAGALTDKLNVGKAADAIAVSPTGDKLFLTDRETKSVQVVSLDFIVDLNLADAPFKGPADAPVVMAVFSDFQ